MTTDSAPRFLSGEDIAAEWGIDPSTARRWMHLGLFGPVIKVRTVLRVTRTGYEQGCRRLANDGQTAQITELPVLTRQRGRKKEVGG